jgi:hypothetical protein
MEWQSQNEDSQNEESQDEVYPGTPQLVDAASLSRHWLSWLNKLAINATWKTLHADYSRLVEPWIAQLDGAANIFGKVPFVGQIVTSNQSGLSLTEAKRNVLSIEELSNFINLYQQLRVVRAEALAHELYHLADIYEAHSFRLKSLLTLQAPRQNTEHIPASIRCEARRIVKRASNTWWKYKETYRYRFSYPFPVLVPYDWTIQLFCKVLQNGLLSKSLYPGAIVRSCTEVLQAILAWTPDILRHFERDETVGLSRALDLVALEPKGSKVWQDT